MEWISVSDRLPPIDKEILATGWNKHFGPIQPTIAICRDHTLDPKGCLQMLYFDGMYRYNHFMASHWMALPSLPEAILSKWEDANKTLPSLGETVLVMLENKITLLAWYEEKLKWCSNDYRIRNRKIIKWAHIE